jgi:hypothetical protein
VSGTNVIASGLSDVFAVAGAGDTLTVDLVSSNYESISGEPTVVTPPGTNGNQTEAPIFVDAPADDFHQAADSPTIDAGSNAPALSAFDIDNEARVQGEAPDIGADEFTPVVEPPEPPEPPPTPDTSDPQTSITAGPKTKTKKRSARFEFASSEAGSSFACSLDGGDFAPCASPFVASRVRRGKHAFVVLATDAAGNTDSTPAVKRWTVTRKRRPPAR